MRILHYIISVVAYIVHDSVLMDSWELSLSVRGQAGQQMAISQLRNGSGIDSRSPGQCSTLELSSNSSRCTMLWLFSRHRRRSSSSAANVTAE